jgi:putative GTP pyrophosphokinase
MTDIDAIRQSFQQERSWLEGEVQRGLRSLLLDARTEFRQQHPDIAWLKEPECRIKDLEKILEKLERKARDWPFDRIFTIDDGGRVQTIVNDLVGGRLICATPMDVQRVVEILRAWSGRLVETKSEYVHYIERGYRAYHIDACVAVWRSNQMLYFPVEIQIKTLLQDAWSNFGHDEFYKPSADLPEITQKISRYLADALSALDSIGEAIREEKLKKKDAIVELSPEETLVTERTLSYLVNRIFQTTMNEVELQRCVGRLKTYGYDSIARADALLRDPQVTALVEASRSAIHISGHPTAFEIAYFGPIAAEQDSDAVVCELRGFYGLSDHLCASCDGPISQDEMDFIDKKTDLDLIYYCRKCSEIRLRSCGRCGRYTESKICKDCRAETERLEII